MGGSNVQLPSTFTEKIGRVFGEQGRAWLETVPQLLLRCQERWQLTDLRLADGLSYNLICFAKSPAHGDAVLKLGVPRSELVTEIKALSLYAGRGICACHDADAAQGVLLLERIVPGADLRSVTDRAERFRIAADLFANLPVALAGDYGFPSYRDWIIRAFAKARTGETRVGPDLLAFVDAAAQYFAEIDAAGRPRLLLHGDLHHMNILQDGRGGWKAIDPKGVIGVAAMGAARFMQNEFRLFDPADRLERLDQMTAVFAERLGEPRHLVAKCGFVEHVLATVWSAEENEAPEALAIAVAECAELLDYCRSLK